MKKTFIVIIMAAMGLYAHAQNENNKPKSLTIGIKAELNSDFMQEKGVQGVTDWNFGIGENAGITLKRTFTKHFAIQAEVLLQQNRSRLTYNSVEEKCSGFGIMVPFYFMPEVHCKNTIFYLGVGPWGSAGLSAKIGEANLYDKNNEYFTLSRWNLGAGMLLGVEFGCGLQINLNYRYAFFNSAMNDNGNLTEHQASIGLGYRF